MRRYVSAVCLFFAALSLHAKPLWRAADIPILPAGASLGPLWAGLSGDLYVWAETRGGASKDVPTAHLLHWTGSMWRVALKLPGHAPAAIFGVSPTNVFAAANKCAAGRAAGCGADRGARIFRAEDLGNTWVPQALPPAADGRTVTGLSGSYNNVQAALDGSVIVYFDGVAWSPAFQTESDKDQGTLSLTLLSGNEGYLTNCSGWGRWVDGAWKMMPAEFGFCATQGLWGIRDRAGILRLYAVDSHRFDNGVRVWQFDAPSEDFTVVFEESSEEQDGAATGMWGSAQDDLYVIGRIGAEGRIYHFDGTSWSRETGLGNIPPLGGVHGTSRNDVWVSLYDGRLFHYSTAATTTRRMSGLSTPQ